LDVTESTCRTRKHGEILAWFASRWCPQAEVEEPELDKDRASAATESGKHAGFPWRISFRPNSLYIHLFASISLCFKIRDPPNPIEMVDFSKKPTVLSDPEF